MSQPKPRPRTEGLAVPSDFKLGRNWRALNGIYAWLQAADSRQFSCRLQ